MSKSDETSFEFRSSVETLIAYAEAEKKASTEFKRIVRAKQWRHAHLVARGVQSHMEFMFLGTGFDSPPEFIDVPRKLQRLIFAARIAHFENSGKNWYHYNLRAEFAVTLGGYHVAKTTDCEKEPFPFSEAVPWEKAMVEEAEFDIPTADENSWLRKRLTNQG